MKSNIKPPPPPAYQVLDVHTFEEIISGSAVWLANPVRGQLDASDIALEMRRRSANEAKERQVRMPKYLRRQSAVRHSRSGCDVPCHDRTLG